MKMVFKLALAAAYGYALLIGAPRVMAAQDEGPAPKPEMKMKMKTMMGEERVAHLAYLGVAVAPTFPGMIKHVPEGFSEEQGVMVVAVAKDSPAEKAGIKPRDILMLYDDQKLFAPMQLIRLVRSDKPGHEITLTVLRDEKPQKLKMTLASHEVRYIEGHMPMPGRMPHWRMGRGMMQPEANAEEQQTERETFDSMTLKNLGKGRFDVQIAFLDKSGKIQSRKFEGTRREIRRSILAQTDLPTAERLQLLRSLSVPLEESIIPEIARLLDLDRGDDRSDGVF